MNGFRSRLAAGLQEMPAGSQPRATLTLSTETQAPPVKKRILFVDDEPAILHVYDLMFQSHRKEWQMDFANNGYDALDRLSECQYDAVVSDMRMPELNGAQLLNEVSLRQPRTARFIISGYSDREQVMKCLRGTHQFMSKPFKVSDLQDKVVRSMQANEWLSSDALREVVASLFILPSLPSSYFQVLREIALPQPQAENIGAIVARDPAMTAKLLQIVNSAFFGLSRQITNPTEAVIHLGIETVRSLALGIQIFAQFDQLRSVEFSIGRFVRHSLKTATSARAIAHEEYGEPSMADEAFTAGLLMDIGTLVMVQNLAPAFDKALEISRMEMKPMWEAEREVLGVTHAEIGAYLLALWGLPMPIVEAVLHHHHPERCQIREFSPLSCVHAANALEHEHRIDEPAYNLPEMSLKYFEGLGKLDRVEQWREVVGQASLKRTEEQHESMPD